MPGMKPTMDEDAAGDLHSGSPSGPPVTNRKQAIAIGLSEQKKGAKDPMAPGTFAHHHGHAAAAMKAGNHMQAIHHAKHMLRAATQASMGQPEESGETAPDAEMGEGLPAADRFRAIAPTNLTHGKPFTAR